MMDNIKMALENSCMLDEVCCADCETTEAQDEMIVRMLSEVQPPKWMSIADIKAAAVQSPDYDALVKKYSAMYPVSAAFDVNMQDVGYTGSIKKASENDVGWFYAPYNPASMVEEYWNINTGNLKGSKVEKLPDAPVNATAFTGKVHIDSSVMAGTGTYTIQLQQPASAAAPSSYSIGVVATEANTFQSQIANLQAQVATLQSQVTSLQGDLICARATIATLT